MRRGAHAGTPHCGPRHSQLHQRHGARHPPLAARLESHRFPAHRHRPGLTDALEPSPLRHRLVEWAVGGSFNSSLTGALRDKRGPTSRREWARLQTTEERDVLIVGLGVVV